MEVMPSKLRTVLSPRRHILNSVEEFHARVEELELDQDDRLITADVKDFIVGGDHWYQVRMAASILEHEGQEFDRESHSVLLRNQFVTSILSESEGVFQVEQGSGSGFVASGEISESVNPEARSEAREAHQSLFQVQRRHHLDCERR